MDIIEFQDDQDAKENGIKIYLNKDKSAGLVVAAWGTPKFWESYRKQKDLMNKDFDDLTSDEQRKILANTVADSILLGWFGLTDGDEDVEYSKEKAAEWLYDPAKERFFIKVQSEAENINNYKAKRLESEKKS